jgi:8-oxo-dGTP pyrophosphatase MutT (NUDIX family)
VTAPVGSGHPDWVRPLVEAGDVVPAEWRGRVAPPPDDGRPGAVLLLLGEGPDGPGVLLIERAHDMRSHAGQMAFPGGGVDPGDADSAAAALREAQEETGLDPSGVDVLRTFPAIYLPPSGFHVTPVLGWWRRPSPVSVVDPREVASVHRVPLRDLVDPVNRVQLRHSNGYVGPAFRLGDLLVWGFTAGLLDRLLHVAGLERPWDRSTYVDLPPHQAALATRTQVPR